MMLRSMLRLYTVSPSCALWLVLLYCVSCVIIITALVLLAFSACEEIRMARKLSNLQIIRRERCNRIGVHYVSTVEQFVDVLDLAEWDAQAKGLDVLVEDESIGMCLLYPDGNLLQAPRTWEEWGVVVQYLDPNERRQPFVVMPKSSLYGPENFQLPDMPAIPCPKCGELNSDHDGILLKCVGRNCGWRLERLRQ